MLMSHLIIIYFHFTKNPDIFKNSFVLLIKIIYQIKPFFVRHFLKCHNDWYTYLCCHHFPLISCNVSTLGISWNKNETPDEVPTERNVLINVLKKIHVIGFNV